MLAEIAAPTTPTTAPRGPSRRETPLAASSCRTAQRLGRSGPDWFKKFLPTQGIFAAACVNPRFVAEYRRSVLWPGWGEGKERSRWRRWTRLGRRSSGFPSGSRGSMANGQSWATSSTNWKSPNAFWRDSAEKRRRPRDGGEDARQGLRQQPVGSAAP